MQKYLASMEGAVLSGKLCAESINNVYSKTPQNVSITFKKLLYSAKTFENSISQLDKAYEVCRKETQQWAKTFLGNSFLPLEKEKAI